ncbi:MAG: hypothetical protein ACRCZJ_09260 [Erysipelotrichaceae bacterium]
MTRTLVFVKELPDASVIAAIQEVLDDSRVVFELSEDKKAIVVAGDHDMANVAKKLIDELGYTIL